MTYEMYGSVSSGTMRPEDLIPAFLAVADEICNNLELPGPTTEPPEETEWRKQQHSRIDDLLAGIEQRWEAKGYYDSEEAMWDLESLFDLLDEFAPEGHYFGAHPGDGADYGFWECEYVDNDESE